MANYYNGVLLPEIPEDVLAKYPYCWILVCYSAENLAIPTEFRLFASKTHPWYTKQDDNGLGAAYLYQRIFVADTDEYGIWLLTDEEWVFRGSFTGKGGTIIDLNYSYSPATLLWSNHDIPNGSATATEIYFGGSEPVPESEQEPDVPVRTSGYIIRSNSTLYTIADGALTALTETEITASLFQTYGVDEIPSSDLLVTLTDPVVYYWTTADEITPLIAMVQGVPFPQTLESEDYDMTDETILGIEKVLVDASDGVRFAVSFDAGQTWKLHTGENWATLSEGDTGMSPSVLSAIPTEDWNAEATTGKFRFRVTLSTVDDYVNSLVVDYLN